MPVDSSTYTRKLQCCKSMPNVIGPQGPQGESGIGILNMLYFEDITALLNNNNNNNSPLIVDLSYNNTLTVNAGLNGFFTENTNATTNIIFNKLTNPETYGIEIYAHCDISGSKSDDTIILDLSGTDTRGGFNNKILIDARSVNLKLNNNGFSTSVSFGPVMYRITNSNTTLPNPRVIHTDNKYRFKATLRGPNNETITLSNTQLVIKAIKTGIPVP